MPNQTVDRWFAEYGETHRNLANQLIHWICAPVILFCLLGFVWAIPVSESWESRVPWFNWSLVAITLVFGFYLWLSRPLAVGLLVFMTGCHALLLQLDFYAPWSVWQICLVLFVVAWIGQFIGYRIEGRRPSFLKGLLFLLIGPAWLLGSVFRKIGLRY